MSRKPYREIVLPEEEILSMLSKSYLCNGMSPAELKAISPFFLTLHVAAGATVYDEGDRESFLCLIASGAVSVVKGLRSHAQQVITDLGPGESVGEVSLIDNHPRSASVVASTDTVLFSLTSRNLLEMHDKAQPAWSKIIYNISISLAARLRTTTDLLAENMGINAGLRAKQPQ